MNRRSFLGALLVLPTALTKCAPAPVGPAPACVPAPILVEPALGHYDNPILVTTDELSARIFDCEDFVIPSFMDGRPTVWRIGTLYYQAEPESPFSTYHKFKITS